VCPRWARLIDGSVSFESVFHEKQDSFDRTYRERRGWQEQQLDADFSCLLPDRFWVIGSHTFYALDRGMWETEATNRFDEGRDGE